MSRPLANRLLIPNISRCRKIYPDLQQENHRFHEKLEQLDRSVAEKTKNKNILLANLRRAVALVTESLRVRSHVAIFTFRTALSHWTNDTERRAEFVPEGLESTCPIEIIQRECVSFLFNDRRDACERCIRSGETYPNRSRETRVTAHHWPYSTISSFKCHSHLSTGNVECHRQKLCDGHQQGRARRTSRFASFVQSATS